MQRSNSWATRFGLALSFLFLAPLLISAPETTVSLFPVAGRVLGPGDVRTGLDVAAADQFRMLKGKRVGLFTHRAAINRSGEHILDSMRRAGVNVVTVFAPEHGLYGNLDTHVDDFRETQTGIMVRSLYTTYTLGRKARNYPRYQDLKDLDVVVIDLQDIGARFYTYSAMLGFMMDACTDVQVPVVVLDRPNPIGGVAVDGPRPDPDAVGTLAVFYPLPVVHGMTMGELAKLYKGERLTTCNLSVVEVQGWKRSEFFDQTGLRWLDPSPNIQTLDAAIAYPGVAMVERTVSMGRGTTEPFAVFGAPWIDAPQALAEALTTKTLPGVQFTAVDFTPSGRLAKDHPGENKLCRGVRFEITDRTAFRPVAVGIHLMCHLYERYGRILIPERKWNPATRKTDYTGFSVPLFDPLDCRGLTASWIAGAIRDKKSAATILAVIDREVAEFRAIREKYLIYRD